MIIIKTLIMEDTQNIRVITLNVRGLHNSIKRRNILKWILYHKIHVIFMQETFCTKQLEPYLKAGWKGESIHNTTHSSHSKGVSILIHPSIKCNIECSQR